MVATYRLQLQPDFTFADAEAVLPYLQQLGVSHVYLSPITQSRAGSDHGYDVIDHNQLRHEFGGREGFDRFLEKAREHGLEIIIDFVPNHAGVGPRNAYWQDVLAYGPNSPYAHYFDIDWMPLKPELHGKILLAFLGDPYGDVFDNGDITITYESGRFYASYFENRYALTPATYTQILETILPRFERTDLYWDFKDLVTAYEDIEANEREKAEALRQRLMIYAERTEADLNQLLEAISGEALHSLLERQFWRLSYWKTAGYEINYRRFFDINGLVGLRMEDEQIFWDAHRLLGELLAQEGVAGVRIDHVDGLFDPHRYLDWLRDLGAQRIWVEKILARGEIMPEEWPVEGTTGYEFMNDVMGVLVQQNGQVPLERTYHSYVPDMRSYEETAYESKRVVMATTLSSELFRLAYELDRLSEADYHTRDFTLEALREALLEVVAAFDRYRTYLPYDPEDAHDAIREAVAGAQQRNPAMESTVYRFIQQVVMGQLREDLTRPQQAWTGRFQQYTAPVAAKGVEDTAFYRYLLLVALNEVGGEPGEFGIPLQAFHSRARFRANHYPCNLLATATHDHKRGEDTRMRLLALAELTDEWESAVVYLGALADEHSLDSAPSRHDEYLFFQILAALWHDADHKDLEQRLQDYMLKASRESKLRTSWINEDAAYEETLGTFVSGMVQDARTGEILMPLSERLAHLGFFNSLSQVVLKFTTPGVPDLYQGTEFFDLSLVDPDNRRPVDYGLRMQRLQEIQAHFAGPATDTVRGMIDRHSADAKFYFTARLLRLRRDREELMTHGAYRPLEPEGPAADHWIAYARMHDDAALVVLAPRFLATFDPTGEARIELPEELRGGAWTEVLSGETIRVDAALNPSDLPLPWAVLVWNNE